MRVPRRERRGTFSGGARRRGSVVVFVLGIILLASFLITKLMDRAAVELAAESKAAKRADLRQEALSALEASLAVLADEAAAGDGLHDTSEGWDQPLKRLKYEPTEGYTAEVTVADETGKLSLPRATDEALVAYVEAIGVPATMSDRVVDALLTWTKAEHIPQESGLLEFDSAAVPYEAPQRPLRSFEELRAIPVVRELFFDEFGQWNEMGRRFQAGASLFSFNATNVNSAPADALLAQGMERSRISEILAARATRTKGSGLYRSPAELAGAWGKDAAPPGLGTEALCLHVTVEVKYGGRDYRLQAWVGRPGAVAPNRVATGPTGESAGLVKPAEAVSVRNNPRKKVDYPFQILELRENDGS